MRSQLPYIDADIVKTLHSAEGGAKIEFLLRRSDGLYEYRGYVERFEGGPYWSPSEHSGLYETIDEAEQAARRAVPWLQNSN